MKKIGLLFTVALLMFATIKIQAQGNRPSPLTKVTETINTGASITILYSQPSVKGRSIGKDLEPMEGKVWRTGANEATIIKTDKDLTISGKVLPAGKYALFTIAAENNWTVIFNSVFDQWGTYDYNEAKDVLRIMAKAIKAPDAFSEKMTFRISKNGMISLLWGAYKVEFLVQ